MKFQSRVHLSKIKRVLALHLSKFLHAICIDDEQIVVQSDGIKLHYTVEAFADIVKMFNFLQITRKSVYKKAAMPFPTVLLPQISQ